MPRLLLQEGGDILQFRLILVLVGGFKVGVPNGMIKISDHTAACWYSSQNNKNIRDKF